MPKLRVAAFGISVDGYGAGPGQDLENPLGVGGFALHEWVFGTRFFAAMQGKPGGETGVDNSFAERGFENVGAWILGRNMFGPVRGAWPNEPWNGWWGDTPPYHVPVFVLTHHPREPLVMNGGTTFHFVTDGIEAARDRAFEAAGGKDVRIGGGADTIRQYLQAGYIDEMHFAISPVLMGSGEALFTGIDTKQLGFSCSGHVFGERATHVTFSRE